ncbi:MAG: hypothetical protein EOO01_19515, partial [Chitinophagaceae bacterium]
MARIISALFLLLVASLTEAKNNDDKIKSQYGFVENKGQIINQQGAPNHSVLYLWNGAGLHVQLRSTGFS